MKKHRKQVVYVYGEKWLIDVPVDGELYKADNREEYQRKRSRAKHVSMDFAAFAELVPDVAEVYEQAQLLTCLRKALITLSEEERRLIKCIYFDGLTEREVADIFKVSQPAITKRKHKIIKKLRKSLVHWIEI